MSFVLGFYVSLIVKRWWEQYKLLPWPDTLALFISAAIPGNVSYNAAVMFVQTRLQDIHNDVRDQIECMCVCQLVIASTCSRLHICNARRRLAPITGTHICINLYRCCVSLALFVVDIFVTCFHSSFKYFILCLTNHSHPNHTLIEWNWPFDATKHHALLGAGLRHYIDENFATCQTAISFMATFGRCRPNAGEREENLRNNGWQKSHVQVLDAIGVGHQYYQSGTEAGDHRLWSHCANAASRIVGHSAAVGCTYWLWHRLCAAGLHTGELLTNCCGSFWILKHEKTLTLNNAVWIVFFFYSIFTGRHVGFVHVFHSGIAGPTDDPENGWSWSLG